VHKAYKLASIAGLGPCTCWFSGGMLLLSAHLYPIASHPCRHDSWSGYFWCVAGVLGCNQVLTAACVFVLWDSFPGCLSTRLRAWTAACDMRLFPMPLLFVSHDLNRAMYQQHGIGEAHDVPMSLGGLPMVTGALTSHSIHGWLTGRLSIYQHYDILSHTPHAHDCITP